MFKNIIVSALVASIVTAVIVIDVLGCQFSSLMKAVLNLVNKILLGF